MISFESPLDFCMDKKNDGYDICYSDLFEISQGGPVFGSLSINRKMVQGYKFGGPYLISRNILYIPVLSRKFLGVGFQLGRLNLENMELNLIGRSEPLIFLDRIDDEVIYDFGDLDKTIERKYVMS